MGILNAIYWNVSPEIFSLGPFSIRYYGLLFAGGFMISFYMVQKFYKDAGLDPVEVDKLTIYTVIGAVLGARFGHVFFYESDYYLQNPSEILKVWHGGLASHGGVIGIVISTWLYSRKYKRPYLWVLDRLVVPSALTGSLIRLGNLMNSEIYGHETSLPWGFVFLQNGETVPKHPTQIYESLAYLIIFVFLYYLYKRNGGKIHRGMLVGWFLVTIFGFRFFIELIKNNQVAKEASMTFNIGQWLSIPLIVFGAILLFYSKKQKIDVF